MEATPPPARPRRRRWVLFGSVGVAVVAAAVIAFLLLRRPVAEVTTPQGTVTIENVQSADRWPEDCDEDRFAETNPACIYAQDGFDILVVSMTADFDVGAALPADVTVADETGDTWSPAAWGGASEPWIAIPVPEDASGLTLRWPGNEPIDL